MTFCRKPYVAWLQDQAAKLRSPDRNTLDWQTLAEELEEMVDERKYKAESFLFPPAAAACCSALLLLLLLMMRALV